jgi:hypothetical protein
MMARALAPPLLLLGLLAGVAACASTVPDPSQLAPWDQTRVTATAKQLAVACDAWRQVLREQSGTGARLGSGYAQDFLELEQNAELLREQSMSLAAHLEDGQGMAQTVDAYRALKETVDDSQVETREVFLEKPTLAAWERVSGLVGQLAPYYDPHAAARAK